MCIKVSWFFWLLFFCGAPALPADSGSAPAAPRPPAMIVSDLKAWGEKWRLEAERLEKDLGALRQDFEDSQAATTNLIAFSTSLEIRLSSTRAELESWKTWTLVGSSVGVAGLVIGIVAVLAK